MDYALGGPNLNQMTLTGYFTLVLLRPGQQDRHQAMEDQVSFLVMYHRRKANILLQK